MTEIKIARAYGNIFNDQLDPYATARQKMDQKEPVLIVHGLTESELRELVARPVRPMRPMRPVRPVNDK